MLPLIYVFFSLFLYFFSDKTFIAASKDQTTSIVVSGS